MQQSKLSKLIVRDQKRLDVKCNKILKLISNQPNCEIISDKF